MSEGIVQGLTWHWCTTFRRQMYQILHLYRIFCMFWWQTKLRIPNLHTYNLNGIGKWIESWDKSNTAEKAVTVLVSKRKSYNFLFSCFKMPLSNMLVLTSHLWLLTELENTFWRGEGQGSETLSLMCPLFKTSLPSNAILSLCKALIRLLTIYTFPRWAFSAKNIIRLQLAKIERCESLDNN